MNRDIKSLKANWEAYVLHGHLNEDVRPEIKEAWDRCLADGVDYNDGYGHVISDQELEQKLLEHKRLIEIASPVMENIYEVIKTTSFSIVLTDVEGILLHVIESKNIALIHDTLNFVLGTQWDEKNVGANAIGTALARDEAIHMKGAEHFCISHHPWTCSASPIHDSQGRMIGCLDISGSVEDDHIHTFAIVTTAAKIIEKQLDLMRSYELVESAFNSVLEGMFVIDRDYQVTHLNEKISKMVHLTNEEFKQLDMKKVFKDIDIEAEVFGNSKRISLNDYSMNVGRHKVDCLINISPIRAYKGVSGAVISVKEAKHVRKIVSQMAGFEAGYTFSDIITEDPQMMKTIEFAKKIARTDSTVLIQGESGTGKELFAHSIHNESHRQEGPFIAINCAALPNDLVESELFGYEKGAFTGAVTDGKPGKFELANGGTIFLDEIGELPLEMQSKLLRVLDNQKVTRVGGRHERTLDVRIVAATNRDLKSEVEIKRFREDLYFRLNVINLILLPLRKRRRDIGILAQNFLDHQNKQHEDHKEFTEDFLKMLDQRSWKGNVRELKHFVQREYFMSNESLIDFTSVEMDPQPLGLNINSENLQDMEKLCIIEALKTTEGNVIEAAKRLNVGKSTVYRKVKEYQIDVKEFKKR